MGLSLKDREYAVQFEEIFKLHFRSLCYYAMSLVKDEEAARDIVHDTFMTLWNGRHENDFFRPKKAYLTVLVRNQCFNYLEHLKVKDRHAQEELTLGSIYADAYSEEEEELLEAILRRIDQLPGKCAEVMRLCFVECKKYKEIAELLGISVNTVKTHVVTGLKILRDEFSDTLILLFLKMKEMKRDKLIENQ